MRILLAMSGGVDSSVVAHMLSEQGHEVIGVRFTLWIDPLAPALAQILPSKCCTVQNINRADSVSKALNIPLHIINLEDEFKKTVVDPYLEAHAKGLTPNPCIGCNRTIKFGKLIELMREYNCEKLATGHYVRNISTPHGYEIHEAIDRKKDQSYYLYGIDPSHLPFLLFPLGDMRKDDVYTLAKRYSIPLPELYKESQDLCFFPEKKPTAFLKRYLSSSLLPGDIVDTKGKKHGTHKGLPLYTVGQRHGLGIGGLSIPLHVVQKNIQTNELIVAPSSSISVQEFTLSDVRFLQSPSSFPLSVDCRFRSLSPARIATLLRVDDAYRVISDTPMFPQSPGQSIVFYKDGTLLGGGVIAFQK